MNYKQELFEVGRKSAHARAMAAQVESERDLMIRQANYHGGLSVRDIAAAVLQMLLFEVGDEQARTPCAGMMCPRCVRRWSRAVSANGAGDLPRRDSPCRKDRMAETGEACFVPLAGRGPSSKQDL